jgi:hypothetical protein
MNDSSQLSPDFKDRSVGLILFGVISILIGLCSVMLVPLSLISVTLSGPAAKSGLDLRSAMAASALYAVIAIAFVWLGIGSIRARRWARELLLSLSWIWLLTGICSLAFGVVVVPLVIHGIAAETGLPPETVTLVVAVVFCVIGVLYVVLPMAFVMFYRSPHVAATCAARDPRPQWVDRCPQRLLTLTVVWVLAGVSVLLMPAYAFFFPLFGVVATGLAGALLWFLVLAVCVALVIGTSRGALWAWWGGMALAVMAMLSSAVTVLRYDLGELMTRMEMPPEQASMMASFNLFGGWSMALIVLIIWGTFIVYLLSLRRYFEPTSSADA